MPDANIQQRLFVSEPIEPDIGSSDIGAMSRGEPGVPRAFIWRGRRYRVAHSSAARRALGEDRGDVYVRRHYYDVETTDALRMNIYFERNPSNRSQRKRWWLYTVALPAPVIETTRLQMRRWTNIDRDAFKAMTTDPDVMRFVHDGRPFTDAEVDAALASTIEHYALGFGDWAILQRGETTIMGESGLTTLPETGEIEITWLLQRPYWSQGFGFEAATAVRDHAFRVLGLKRLVASIEPRNERSIFIAEKLGMRVDSTLVQRGREMLKYAIEA